MTASVGRLRPCGLLDWKFTVLSHNTVRGAAGATLLNAELLASLGKLEAGKSEARPEVTLKTVRETSVALA
jgi:aspartate-semialdehyde dehydrogenase